MSQRPSRSAQPGSLLKKWFKLADSRTAIRTEVFAGLTTFGMPFEAVMMATVASSVVATVM